MSTPKPKYDIWQAIQTALALSLRAIDEIRALSRLPGPKGDPGEPGLGFDDLKMVHDGERGFAFRLSRGDQVKEFPFTVPFPIYRGVFKDGNSYKQADMVTSNGSVWHCNEATGEKPGTSKAWTLSVRAGRDGKDGKLPPKPSGPIKL